MKPSFLIITAILFCCLLFIAACKKDNSSLNSIAARTQKQPTPAYTTPGIEKLAGKKTFLLRCGSYSNNTNYQGTPTSSLYTDSIIIVDNSRIVLFNENDTLTLSPNPYSDQITFMYDNTPPSYSISYRPGSDTIFYLQHESTSTIASNCNGICIGHLLYSSTYHFTCSGNLYCWDTISFHSNAPAGATLLWDFGDGANSTDPNPTHVFSLSYNTITLIVNGRDAVSQTLNLTYDLHNIGGLKHWKATTNTVFYSPYLNTTYALNDTTFTVTGTGNGITFWGLDLQSCVLSSNITGELDFCNSPSVNESYSTHYYHSRDSFVIYHTISDALHQSTTTYYSQ